MEWCRSALFLLLISGIRSKLGHLSYLRVDAVLLSSVVKSANVDVARDPVDFFEIDPTLGTMKDFESLIQELHDRGKQRLHIL